MPIRQRIDTTKVTTVSLGIMPGDWPLLSVDQKAAAIMRKYPGINAQTLVATIARLDAKHPLRPRIEYRERTVAVPAGHGYAFPAGDVVGAPDFTTGNLDAYWRYVEGSFSNTCVTSGYEFVTHLRGNLGISMDPVWDLALQNALIDRVAAITRIDPSWQTVLTALQQDRDAQTVGQLSLHEGIFTAYYEQNGRRFDAITILPGTIAPVWGQSIAPGNPTLGLRCYDESIDPDPRVSTPDQTAEAIAASVTGVRIESGRPGPASSSVTIDRSTGGTALTVLLLSALFVGVGVWAWKK